MSASGSIKDGKHGGFILSSIITGSIWGVLSVGATLMASFGDGPPHTPPIFPVMFFPGYATLFLLNRFSGNPLFMPFPLIIGSALVYLVRALWRGLTRT